MQGHVPPTNNPFWKCRCSEITFKHHCNLDIWPHSSPSSDLHFAPIKWGDCTYISVDCRVDQHLIQCAMFLVPSDWKDLTSCLGHRDFSGRLMYEARKIFTVMVFLTCYMLRLNISNSPNLQGIQTNPSLGVQLLSAHSTVSTLYCVTDMLL